MIITIYTHTQQYCLLAVWFLVYCSCRYYVAPGREQSIVMCMFVVCLSDHLHNSNTARRNFAKFFVHIACGQGLVLLWWHCNRLCTSGFMNDVMFSYHGANGQNQARRYVLKSSPVCAVFGWVRPNVALGVKSPIYECLVIVIWQTHYMIHVCLWMIETKLVRLRPRPKCCSQNGDQCY